MSVCLSKKILISALSISIVACGGSGNGSNSAANATSNKTLTAGNTAVVAANTQLLVPKGTSITTPSGNTVWLYGSNPTLTIPANSTVNVPTTATGTATYTLTTTVSSSSANVTTLSATQSFIAGSATATGNTDGTGSGATFAQLGNGMAIDTTGNAFIINQGLLRKVTPTGVVTTINNFSTLYTASIDLYPAIAIDKLGNIFVSQHDINFILGSPGPLATPSGFIDSQQILEFTTTGQSKFFNSGWELSSLTSPSPSGFTAGGLTIDDGSNLYVADTTNNRIVKFNPSGSMSVFAGSGTAGFTDSSGTAATFKAPSDVAIDGNNNLYVADSGNNAIRKITPNGTVSTITIPSINKTIYISKIAVDSKGNIFFAYSGLTTTPSASGIYRLDTTGNFTDFPVSTSAQVTSLATDNTGNVYFILGGINSSPVGSQIFKMIFSN